MKKVILISNLPTSYFVDYSFELSKYVQLKVIYEKNYNLHKKCKVESDIFSFVDTTFLEGLKINEENYLSLKIVKYLKKRDFDYVIFANPCTATGIIGELYCRRHKIPYIIQSEGGLPGSGKGWKERLKKRVMENACLYLSGTGLNNNYFLKYGASEEKIKKYGFSSQHENDIDSKPLTKREKAFLKKKYNVNEKLIILCVGQFIHRKGIDTLLKSLGNLNDEVGVYIIGGTPTKEYLQLIKDYNLKRIHFIERVDFCTTNDYYRLSDIFVLLSREDTWGLVINEAMSHSLPVITTNKVVSATELIEEGINGFIIEPDNEIEARKKIDILINNGDLRKKMGEANLLKIKDYTIEKMAKTISYYLNQLP